MCAARTKARTTEWTRVLKNSGQFSKNRPTIEYSKSDSYWDLSSRSQPRIATKKTLDLHNTRVVCPPEDIYFGSHCIGLQYPEQTLSCTFSKATRKFKVIHCVLF